MPHALRQVSVQLVHPKSLISCVGWTRNVAPLASSRSTALTISDNVDALLAKLYNRPLAVPRAARPGILTSSMIEGLIFCLLTKTPTDVIII